MLNKKGQGISLNFIIIAALAVIALIIIALFFTGGIQKLFTKETEVIKATEQELALAKTNCQFWCSTGLKDNYNKPPFSAAVKNAGYKICADFDGLSSFEESCGSCSPKKDTPADTNCYAQTTQSACTSAQCTWKAAA